MALIRWKRITAHPDCTPCKRLAEHAKTDAIVDGIDEAERRDDLGHRAAVTRLDLHTRLLPRQRGGEPHPKGTNR